VHERGQPDTGADLDRDTGTALEIRSYRQVFALERRLYRIDGLRLNPAGVPLRGIGCFLACACVGLAAARLPLVAIVARIVPWYLRDAAVPALAAFLLTGLRLDGRPVHLSALALLRWRFGARQLVGLRRVSPAPARRRLCKPMRVPEMRGRRMRGPR
jgi:hypothetical protein